MTKNRSNPVMEVKRPVPADITFIEPTTILSPYHKRCDFKNKNLKEAERAFEEYILNGIQWANSSMDPTTRHPSEAVLINNLRLEIERWREGDYEGVTDTTRELFDHWFSLDRDKPLWFCQREAIETLIYLYELKKIKTVSSLIDAFSCLDVKGYEKYDRYPRYAFRMATGSGKTIVIALVIVWSFYNHIWEDKNDFTRFFLIIAPNLIVYDRLARDFENLSIFDDFELIPESWKKEFRIKVITRDTFSPSDRFLPPEDEGVIFVSNIHQIGLKEKKKEKEEERDLLSFFGKLSPGKEPYKSKSLKLWEILDNYPSLMVLKDEAHHIHRLESSWQNYLWGMDERLKESYGEGIFAELDFSATPKDEKGALFPWIIVDFSLKEALQTEIVKYPARVIVEDAPEIKRDAGMEAYRPYIKTALERWREQKKKLDELGKKPVLFVMGTDVEEANEIYKELLKEEDIDQGNMILIHSDLEKWEKTEKRLKTKISWKGGERELDKDLARDIVNDIDNPDNPFSIIVSAMMLNEGWDVNSVTLVLGLRSFASEREVLPEQVIGRGLRKLFRNRGIDLDKWVNVLEVVGPSKLLKTIQKLEEMEGIKIPDAPQKFFITFSPRDIGPEKMINIPILEGWYYWENIN
jgi:type III restriction enzyme